CNLQRICTFRLIKVQMDMWINICRPLVSQLCGPSSAGCQQWDPNSPSGHASMGDAKSLQFVDTSKFETSEFLIDFCRWECSCSVHSRRDEQTNANYFHMQLHFCTVSLLIPMIETIKTG